MYFQAACPLEHLLIQVLSWSLSMMRELGSCMCSGNELLWASTNQEVLPVATAAADISDLDTTHAPFITQRRSEAASTAQLQAGCNSLRAHQQAGQRS